ncbi:hypothetical protein DIE22_30815 [Burkholderia sp. Bp9142]|nr:hypothetical protein DIE22_30815 [Burkholderia sp. Bp9142]
MVAEPTGRELDQQILAGRQSSGATIRRATCINAVFREARGARGAKRNGFGGKLCIHPKQIEPVHAGFAYSTEELAWAQRVVSAVRASGGGAVAVDGKMVDRPVELKALKILAMELHCDAEKS